MSNRRIDNNVCKEFLVTPICYLVGKAFAPESRSAVDLDKITFAVKKNTLKRGHLLCDKFHYFSLLLFYILSNITCFVNHFLLFALIIPPTEEKRVIISADIQPVAAIPVRLIMEAIRKIIRKAGTELTAPIRIPFFLKGLTAV